MRFPQASVTVDAERRAPVCAPAGRLGERARGLALGPTRRGVYQKSFRAFRPLDPEQRHRNDDLPRLWAV